jgi:hypothetical protein
MKGNRELIVFVLEISIVNFLMESTKSILLL